MKQTLLLLIAICISFAVFGQEEETAQERRERLKLERKKSRTSRNSNTVYREFGFNMISIIQTIPVLPTSRTGFPNHVFFFKRKKADKERVFRFHAGGSLGGVELSVTSFELKVGMEYPRSLTKGWEYYYGYDFLTFIQQEGQGGGIGVGPIFGMKYNLNDFITFGTEGSAYFTLSGGDIEGAAINMRPLNGLFMSFKLYK